MRIWWSIIYNIRDRKELGKEFIVYCIPLSNMCSARVKTHIDPRHEITKNEDDDASIVDTAPEIRIMRRVIQ